MVNSEELIGTTGHLTLYMRCRLTRCRYKRVRLYIFLFQWLDIFANDIFLLFGPKCYDFGVVSGNLPSLKTQVLSNHTCLSVYYRATYRRS
jgi:hypothetical protein